MVLLELSLRTIASLTFPDRSLRRLTSLPELLLCSVWLRGVTRCRFWCKPMVRACRGFIVLSMTPSLHPPTPPGILDLICTGAAHSQSREPSAETQPI
eukprot:11649395-Alexandrium_andersonii.AAC.1